MRNLVGKTLLTALIIATASLNTIYANDLENNIASLNNESNIKLTDMVNDKAHELDQLKRIVKNDLNKIHTNDNKIESLNQIVFFYSEKNIVDVVQAVKNGTIDPAPVLQFEEAECGYPIYNGALKKIGQLTNENYTLLKAVKTNQYKITLLENQIADLQEKDKQKKPLYALNQINCDKCLSASY